MKAAIVVEAGRHPVYGDFRDPTPAPGKRIVRVTASAISHLTKGRAGGAHYSADAKPPFVPGVDGVGVTDDGQRVYFAMPEAPFGGMAERCLVDERRCFAIPDDLDDVVAAAMANAAMSSWAALVERAQLRAGETVLVNGATGSSGRLAIQIAKHLGAAKVIATGRRTETFDDLRRLGADATIALGDRDALEAAFMREFAQRIDVVLDYVWGASAETALIAAAKAGPDGVPIRFVQIGSIGGTNVSLPGAVLRSSALQLMGSGIGSVPLPKLLGSIRAALTVAPSAGFEIATRALPLREVANAWAAPDGDARIVLIP
ncbi:MAG TPA: zinc-binding alcohol dehydrogenase family protein [Pseudomonadales bacterium]|nr:zinc-binding alcohol dehydrogenase family protein [Pseudomonadales bacterium]